MVNRNTEPDQLGSLSARPVVEFANDEFTPFGYGFPVPQVGFAADLRKYQEEQARQAKEAMSSIASRVATTAASGSATAEIQEPDVLDTEDDVRRLTSEGIIIGRRVKSKNSDWKKFESKLQGQSRAYRTVPYNKLTMQYLTDVESDGIVDQVIRKNRRRPQVASDERAIIRDFRDNLARSIGNLVSDDWQNESFACEQDPGQARELIEKISYPDRYASSHDGYKPETDNFGIFNTATFWYKGIGSYGVTTKTITLQDSTGVLNIGRQRIINTLHDEFQLDTSGFKEEWAGPQIPIWHMVGRYSLANFRYRLPEIPSVDFTLDRPGVFQR